VTDRTGGDDTTMVLTPAAQKFVLHWGEMGQAWGINRTMPRSTPSSSSRPRPRCRGNQPPSSDVSRSNVSTSLRELITLGRGQAGSYHRRPAGSLRSPQGRHGHLPVIMAERKRRRWTRTIACSNIAWSRRIRAGRPTNTRASNWRRCWNFVRMVTTWYSQIDRLPTPALQAPLQGAPG